MNYLTMNKHMQATMTTREVQQQLAREVACLLDHQPQDGLRWKGTTIDLMEALHSVFVSALIVDDDGVGRSFKYIVDRACAILHVRRPHNPYIVADRGRQRKGLQQLPFIERCRYRLARNPDARPFWAYIVS